MPLDYIRKLILQREYEDALQKIGDVTDADRVEGQTYRGLILSKQNKFDEALVILDELLSEHNLMNSEQFIVRIGKIQVLLRKRDYLNVFGEVALCDELLNKMDSENRSRVKRWEGHLLSTKAMFHVISGEQEEAVDCYSKSGALFEEVDDKYEQLLQIINISWIYRAQGFLDEALEYSKKQFSISESMDEKRYLGWSNFNIGMIYFYKGDIDKAAEHGEIGEKIFRECDHQEGLTLIQTLIGSVYRSKGENEKALTYYQAVLSAYDEKLDTEESLPHSCCLAFRDIGSIYMYQNRLEEAIDFLQKGLKIHKKRCKLRNTVIDYEITVSNLYSVYSKIIMGDMENLQEHIDDIKRTADRYPWLEVFSKATEALVLQHKSRAKDKAKAQELYEEVINEKFDYEMELFIQVNLSELLLDELKLYGEESVLSELQDVLSRISKTAGRQRAINSLIWLYILQAKLAIIEGDAKRAKDLLFRASEITEEKGLTLLSNQIKREQLRISRQLKEWKALFVKNTSLQEQIELSQLKEYISEAVTDFLEKRFASIKKFELIQQDYLKDRIACETCRVGIAQIGFSKAGNVLEEYYIETAPGFFSLKEDKTQYVENRISDLIMDAAKNKVNVLLFPELSIDLNHQSLRKCVKDLASQYGMYIIPGSFHNFQSMQNISIVYGPEGELWNQTKHIPANIHFSGNRIVEGIKTDELPRKIIVSDTEYGRIAIIICRDFLDLDLRVELKNSEPPIDIILNPAFTPVTEDFHAAHFDARRSIYAYCFFANIAEFGNSFIYTPERERTEYEIPAKKEGLIYKDVDLFKLRSERRRWEQEQSKQRQFIQSTRS